MLSTESQNANSKFVLELSQVHQELSEKTTELDGMILALNDACQQNTNFQREAEQQKQVKAAKLQKKLYFLLSILVCIHYHRAWR